jgi:hypothetical protein
LSGVQLPHATGSYLVNFDEDEQIVVREIDLVTGANRRRYCFDELVPGELLVVPDRSSNGKLCSTNMLTIAVSAMQGGPISETPPVDAKVNSLPFSPLGLGHENVARERVSRLRQDLSPSPSRCP